MRHFIFHTCIRIRETMPRGKSFNHSIHLGLERAEKHDLLVKDTLVLVISTLHIDEILEEERNIFLVAPFWVQLRFFLFVTESHFLPHFPAPD